MNALPVKSQQLTKCGVMVVGIVMVFRRSWTTKIRLAKLRVTWSNV